MLRTLKQVFEKAKSIWSTVRRGFVHPWGFTGYRQFMLWQVLVSPTVWVFLFVSLTDIRSENLPFCRGWIFSMKWTVHQNSRSMMLHHGRQIFTLSSPPNYNMHIFCRCILTNNMSSSDYLIINVTATWFVSPRGRRRRVPQHRQQHEARTCTHTSAHSYHISPHSVRADTFCCCLFLETENLWKKMPYGQIIKSCKYKGFFNFTT